MSLESKLSKVEVLPPLKEGEPFNKESLVEEFDNLIKDYNHVQQKGKIPGDSLGVVERRRIILLRMRELALQLKMPEQLSWVEDRMRNYLISIPK